MHDSAWHLAFLENGVFGKTVCLSLFFNASFSLFPTQMQGVRVLSQTMTSAESVMNVGSNHTNFIVSPAEHLTWNNWQIERQEGTYLEMTVSEVKAGCCFIPKMYRLRTVSLSAFCSQLVYFSLSASQNLASLIVSTIVCACSPCVHVGSLQVLWLPPTTQRYWCWVNWWLWIGHRCEC